VLVTGAGGEMGHSLISALAARKDTSVVAMDIRELDPHVREHCENAFVGDVCDANLLERLLAAETGFAPAPEPEPATPP
jgi:FlaA1/EpsC-like NDP-sugar epimerase